MRQGRWLEFVNLTTETIPAFAAIMLESASFESALLTGGSPSRMLINAIQPSDGSGVGKEATSLIGSSNEVVGFGLRDVNAGTFTLSFDGETTAAIDFDATAFVILTSLRALSNIGAADVAVFGGDCTPTGDNRNFYVVFRGALGGIDVADLTGDDASLPGGALDGPTVHAAGGTGSGDKYQLVDLGGATAGTFTLSFSGQTTAAIDFDADDTEVTDALEALSNIEIGDIDTHSGDSAADSGSSFSGQWMVRFVGQFANLNPADLTIDKSGLTDGTAAQILQIEKGIAQNPLKDVGFLRFALHIALNGEIAVPAGRKGLCTLETPAYGLIRDRHFLGNDRNARLIDDNTGTGSEVLTLALPLNDQWFLQPVSHVNGPIVGETSEFDDWSGADELLGVFRIVFLTEIKTAFANTRVALLMRETRV